MISRSKRSWRLAASTRGINFSWQKSRVLSRSMRSSSLSASSSSSGSRQSKTGSSFGRAVVAAAATCGVIVLAPRTCAVAPALSLALAGLVLVRDERGRLDLDPGAIFDQRGDLDHRHRREMPTEDIAPQAADLGQP